MYRHKIKQPDKEEVVNIQTINLKDDYILEIDDKGNKVIKYYDKETKFWLHMTFDQNKNNNLQVVKDVLKKIALSDI